MHVIERQPRIRQRLLPGRFLVAGFPLRFDPLHGFGEARLGATELHAAGAALVAPQPFLQRLLHRALQGRADGRAHRIGIGRDGIDAGNRLGLARHLIDEMKPDVPARPFIGHHRGQRGQSPARLRAGGNDPVLPQAAQDIGEPLLRAAGMAVGRKIVRSLGQPGKQRAFFERELLGRLAEIAARRKLDAPGAAAEIDRVEIELENLRLAQRALHPRSHHHLADLALIGEVFPHQQVLHDLLGDGRAALRAAGLGKIADEGADQAALVDALVVVEALVLRRHECLLHVLGNVGEHHPDPALVLLEHLGKALALAVEHHARSGKLDALELGVIGQVRERLVVEIDDVAEIDRRRCHLLVLAELAVGG